ncbi:MAG: DNA polymerase III subunit beta [Clostridia bacterium]|nr:DNA polymerase III subunit beta [Clostridia bacterium]
MKFRTSNEDLLRGLSTVTRVLSARTTQPILEGVLLQTGDNDLLLTCSDGNMSIVTRVSAQIEENGAVVLPGRLFLDIVRKMPSGELKAAVNSQSVLSLKSGSVRMTLSGQDARFYPPLPILSAENSVELSQSVLHDMIQQTSFAIASESSHRVLTGAFLEISEGEMCIVCLDGYRLALSKQRIADSSVQLKAIIPMKAVQEIGRILEEDEEKTATLQIGGTQMMMTLGVTTVYSTLIDGEYTNYRAILPSVYKTQICIGRESMQHCVERASLIAREGKNNLLKMQISPDELVITSNSETGEIYEKQEVEVVGDDLSIAFNVLYVSDVLRVLPDDEAYMRFNSPVSPCVVCPVSGDSYLYLILPVRVNA